MIDQANRNNKALDALAEEAYCAICNISAAAFSYFDSQKEREVITAAVYTAAKVIEDLDGADLAFQSSVLVAIAEEANADVWEAYGSSQKQRSTLTVLKTTIKAAGAIGGPTKVKA